MTGSVFIACCQPLPLDGTLLMSVRIQGWLELPGRKQLWEVLWNSFTGGAAQCWVSVWGGCSTCEHWLCKLSRWLQGATWTFLFFSFYQLLLSSQERNAIVNSGLLPLLKYATLLPLLKYAMLLPLLPWVWIVTLVLSQLLIITWLALFFFTEYLS